MDNDYHARAMVYRRNSYRRDKYSPTTDRSNFDENEWRSKLDSKARDEISYRLNRGAQRIGDDRQAFETSQNIRRSLEQYQSRLSGGRIDRADLKAVRDDVARINFADERRNAKTSDIHRSRYVADALANKLAQREKRLIRACEIVNEDPEAKEIEKEFDPLMDEILGPGKMSRRGEIWWARLDPHLL